MKIAVIGGGISGMTAAWLLHKKHDITLFEANDYIGGHTHTVDVSLGGVDYAVDTGFIVFNEKTYPNFCKILRKLDVHWQSTRMDFSVKSEKDNFEYNARTIGTLFSQKKNLFSPSFYRMFIEAVKFGKEFDKILEDENEEEIDDYLTKRGYSRRFIEQLIIPLGASLWSSDPEKFRSFPVKSFVRFFRNHGLMTGQDNFLQWLVIKNGSRTYAQKMTEPYKDRIRLNTPVKKVKRVDGGVEITTADGGKEVFDEVVMACHSDQALDIIENPTDVEKDVLLAFPYQDNDVFLHTDFSILPNNKKAWASWNYLIPGDKTGRVAVTYDMNILQTIEAPHEFCVTLNRAENIDENKILQKFVYAHPQYDPRSVEAWKRHGEISGADRIHYCGAYWGYGFHEDGVRSAVDACGKLGGEI